VRMVSVMSCHRRMSVGCLQRTPFADFRHERRSDVDQHAAHRACLSPFHVP